MNREQRRKSQRIKNDKEINEYTEKFSMDFAKILMNHFEKGKETGQYEMNKELEEIMKQKGTELGKVIQNKIMKKQGQSTPIKINFKG